MESPTSSIGRAGHTFCGGRPHRFTTLLNNGNYVVASVYWNGGPVFGRGAVTWGNGTTSLSGTVSAANSLVGSDPGEELGFDYFDPAYPSIDIHGVNPLSDGNYVVLSPSSNGDRGSATWVSGTSGRTLDGLGTVTPQNSLVGSVANARLETFLENPADHTFVQAFIRDGGGRVAAGFTDPSRLSYATAQAQSVTITPTFLSHTLNTGTAVVLQASNDITVNSAITVNAGGHGGALTLQAGRSIVVNAPITTDNGALTLIANDPLANGVVDSQRDPGNAVITTASGTALNTGSGTLTVELRNGADLTNQDSGAITLQTVTAGSVSVVNNGPSAGSDVNLGPITTSGAQSYANPNGTTTLTGNLTATDNSITFTDSVVVSDGVSVTAGASTVNFVNFETGDFSQSATQVGGAIVTSPALDGTYSLQLLRSNSVANVEIRQSGMNYYNLPTASYSFLFQYASQTGEGGVVNFQDSSSNYKAALHLSAAGKLLFYDGTGTLLATGTTTLDANRTYTISATIGTGSNASWEVRLNGNVEMSGSGNLGMANNGSLSLGGNSRYTANYYYDDVAIRTQESLSAGLVNFAGSGTQTLQSGSGSSFGNISHTGSGTLRLTSGLTVTGTFANRAGTFDANDQPIAVAGAATVTGGTYLAGTAPQSFGGGLSITGGVFRSSTGPMTVTGGITLSGGLLSGVGTVDAVTACGGTVAPGSSSPGVLTIDGAVAFDPATTLSILLAGTDAATGYSQLAVGGPIDLGGNTLSLSFGFEPPLGSTFEIIRNTGPGPIFGTFNGLAEGAVFTQGGYDFQITYQGGTGGNSVELRRWHQ
jgi:hypothetical protein